MSNASQGVDGFTKNEIVFGRGASKTDKPSVEDRSLFVYHNQAVLVYADSHNGEIKNSTTSKPKRASSVESATTFNNIAPYEFSDGSEVGRRKLSKRAAKNVERAKTLEFIGGLALIGVGVACVVVSKFLPSGTSDSALQTIGSSLASGGFGLLCGPAQSKIIDAIKKPVNEQDWQEQV
ncbi:MAG: hypothetical protein LBR91_00955 [Puniceicoccales bacterium]|jgi:hypothetical protein|nr:hypothetical protein [Puniceicoccales bacterium]